MTDSEQQPASAEMSRVDTRSLALGARRAVGRGVDVALRDGQTVHVRPAEPADEPGLLAFLRGLSVESRHLRFFSPAIDLEAEARRLARGAADDRVVLIATTGEPEGIIAEADFAMSGPGRAEAAFAVADAWQGRGLGTLLLGQLAHEAAERGIHTFEAVVLASNARMLDVFRQAGFPVEIRLGPGELRVTFPTATSGEALAHFERREQLAAASALASFLRPRAVAVVGASRRRSAVGGAIFHNLLAGEFSGPVYPVNPAAPVVQSVAAYPTVEDIPGPVDLAVIAVPAEAVAEVVDDCGRKGVRALVVVSAGFAEVGAEGRARQLELLRIARTYGMRVIGPNCLGIVNTDPAVRLNATFGPQAPQRGRTGFASQSGALGLVAVEQARAFGLGISSFISVGNKADISGNDLLNYWESDPDTDVVMLYLESFGNPIKFSRIARRVGHTKPIIAVKSGRSKAGARATSSHTGALLAASDVTVDALFRQAGVIRANTFEEMFATAALLGNQPLPRGHRVAIVTNVGGPAILCADACEGLGLELPVLSEATQERLRAFLPEEASVGNPVDLIASATAEQYRQAIEAVTADPGVDAVVAMFIPPLATRTEEIAAAITEATQAGGDDKPLVAVFMTADRPATIPAASPRQVPVYSFPETAATALANATRYAIWRARPLTPPGRPPGLRTDEAAAIVAGALGRGGGWLEPAEVAALLACYGIPMVESVSVGTPDEAAAAARTLGDEVALKAIAPGLSHKTELGAVRLGLRGPAQVGQAAREMAERLTGAGYTPSGFLLQPMIRGGVEMLVGIVRDPSFGPVVAIGAGGTLTELLQDVSVRLAPFVGDEPRAMIRELKTYPLLDGYRGGPHYDIAALEDILLRAGALAEDLPPVIECDLNPVVVLEASAVVLDARVRVAPLRPPEPAPHPA